MSQTETVVDGTLNSDGTVQLDEKPNLLPGRVTITLRKHPQSPPSHEDWFQNLQRIRAEREATAYPFLNELGTIAHIEWLREGDRIDDLLREADLQRQQPEQP